MRRKTMSAAVALPLCSTIACAQPGLEFYPGTRISHADASCTVFVGSSQLDPLDPNQPDNPVWCTPFLGVRDVVNPGALYGEWGLSTMSDDGSTAGGATFNPSGSLQGTLWSSPTSAMPIGYLPRENQSFVFGLNADGSIAVGHSAARPMVWTAATGMVELPLDRGAASPAYADSISSDGSVIVGYTNANSEVPTKPVYWDAARDMHVLPVFDPMDPSGATSGVSSDGSVIGGYCRVNGQTTPVIWRLGDNGYELTVCGLPVNGGFPFVYELSRDGSTLVGAGTNSGAGEYGGWIWTEETGMRDLNQIAENMLGIDLDGWALRFPTAISANGRTVAGTAYHPTLVMYQGFRLTIPDVGADVTTTGATIPGFEGFAVPDGMVDLDDLGAFLNEWVEAGS